MNEVARVEQQTQRLSVTIDMATRYGMDPTAFERTVRSVCMPVKAGDPEPTREEFAAFLLVAREHRLNPVTREIYAMKRKGGGLVPVVGIDGWARLANDHPAFDGLEFEDCHDGDKLISTTCRIYRKDRKHPIAVTEYLSECIRDTDPWKMKHRMLRHKAMIQCARYAFSFAGIYDPDEAERFAAPLSAEPEQRRAPSPSAAPMIEARAEAPAPRADMVVDNGGAIVPETERDPAPAPAQPLRKAPSPSAAPAPQPAAAEPAKAAPAVGHYDPEKVRTRLASALRGATSVDDVNQAWMSIIDPIQDDAFPSDRADWDAMVRLKEAEIGGEEGATP